MIFEGKKVYLDVPEFSGNNVPVTVAARVMNKSALYIRQGMVQGILDIGVVFKKEGSNQYDYYISPKKFWELTGYVYDGENEQIGDPKIS